MGNASLQWQNEFTGGYVDNKPVNSVNKGEETSIPVPNKVRKNDKLFIVVDRESEQAIQIKDKAVL